MFHNHRHISRDLSYKFIWGKWMKKSDFKNPYEGFAIPLIPASLVKPAA